MNAILYQNISESIVINKKLKEVRKVENIRLIENCTMLEPILTLTLPINANYIYIPIWGRYYFIKNIEIINGNQAKVECEVDVLFTFKEQILNTSQNVVRNQNRYNMYLEDPYMTVQGKTQRVNKVFTPPEGGFILNSSDHSNASYCYVLNSV